MAYSRARKEIQLTATANTTTTGVKGTVYCTVRPFTVRAVAAVVKVASATTTSTVISIRKQNAGSTATTDRTVLGTLTIPGAGAVKKSYYKAGFNTTIHPGQTLSAVVTTAATTTGVIAINADVDDAPEEPGNETNMVASA